MKSFGRNTRAIPPFENAGGAENDGREANSFGAVPKSISPA